MQRRRSRPSAAARALHRVRLGRAVQDLADQPAGVVAVDALGDRAQRAGQPQPAGDDQRQLDRGGGDQPDPLPGVEVHLGQRPGAGPDPVGHQLVVDLLAERRELGDRTAGRRTTARCRGRWWSSSAVSRPPTRNLSCCQANPARSEVVKNLRAASPRAKWKIDAPIIIVLSTSKNAAAVGRSAAPRRGRRRRPRRRRRRGLAGPDGGVESADRVEHAGRLGDPRDLGAARRRAVSFSTTCRPPLTRVSDGTGRRTDSTQRTVAARPRRVPDQDRDGRRGRRGKIPAAASSCVPGVLRLSRS